MERRAFLKLLCIGAGVVAALGNARGALSLHSCRSPSRAMIRIWHRSRVSPPRKTWSARKSRKHGMVIGVALIDVIGVVLIGVIGVVSVAAIITDRGRRCPPRFCAPHAR